MSNTWFIADLHLFHKKALDFNAWRRGFGSVESMNHELLRRWNSVVQRGDRVLVIGDVFLGRRDDFRRLWSQFSGRKILVAGANDDIQFLSSGGFFEQVVSNKTLRSEKVIASHQPTNLESLVKSGRINVHGFLHEKNSPDGPYANVSVERTNGYPVDLDEIKRGIARI